VEIIPGKPNTDSGIAFTFARNLLAAAFFAHITLIAPK